MQNKVPTHSNLLKPKILENAHAQIEDKQKIYKQNYDKNTKLSQEFQGGDNVVTYKNKVWEPAKIVQKCETPRSYLIRDNKGQLLRRNSIQIRKSLNEPVVKSDLDDDELNVTSNRNISNSDTETVTDTPYCNRDIASNTKTDDYVTRSGRISKKPKCFTEFVT
ncbi:hypothetical protein RN001_002616 [Aquatica leii]|uniref:Uncharacterized protein n=1 Tax=Aquatica leii TaxID=1421715 RepID=A0AAN7PDQ8_9COLE|nr:hypothetical protein RN001_002616 [Aquatica leii]